MNKTGIELIAQEREEQLTKHGHAIEHDVLINDERQLGVAASYLSYPDQSQMDEDYIPNHWDPEIWKKMMDKPYEERLIIAGALIAAELDRLLYFENHDTEAK